MDRWKRKVAVVTGASSGIGAAIVKVLLQNDIIVVGMARRHDLIKALSTSKNLHSVKVDVTKENEVVKAFKWVIDYFGAIHILVNSAGTVWLTNSFYVDTKLWRDTIDTDLFGLLTPTKIVVEHMIENNIHGQIIHISGITGHNVHIPNFMAIAMSKSAVTTATEYLRRELLKINSKIKVTCISPAAVDTPMSYKNVKNQGTLVSFKKEFDGVLKLDAIDVANAVVYVLETPPHVQVHHIIMRAVGARL